MPRFAPGSRAILHIDMDAFFASVEQRDRPELRGKPVLVGGRARRGVVAAASYEARKFGVYSAMPMAQALRRCPHAEVVSPSLDRYSQVSHEIFAIFARYTPIIEGLSLDEAFLDVSGSQSMFGPPAAIATQIRDDIFSETQLTASAGIAKNKFTAKIASDLNKPNGQFIVDDDIRAFLAPLPIEKMWGVGKKAAEKLHDANIHTIGDIASANVRDLVRLLGSFGARAFELAKGHDDRPVIPYSKTKSIGSENTHQQDLGTREQIERALLPHAAKVAQRLTKHRLRAATVRVKLKYGDFQSLTRQQKLPTPSAETDTLYAAACALLSEFPRRKKGIRLVGLTGADLLDEPAQQELFPEPKTQRAARIEAVQAELAARFGQNTVTRAALIGSPGSADPSHDIAPNVHPGAAPKPTVAEDDSPTARRKC